MRREPEGAINCLSSTGLPKALNRLHRLPKHDTTQLIPSDGFSEFTTTTQQDYLNPKVHTIKQKPVLNMIHKYNIAELALVDRPVRGPSQGFGTVINKHEKGHGQVWRETSTGNAHGYGANLGAAEVTQAFKKQGTIQGGLEIPRPFVNQGVKCVSGLTGEIYKGADPQEATDVQRSWLYTKDPSVKAY